MRTPKVVTPQEDPAEKAAREAEQARAEQSRTEQTQGILDSETLQRLRRFGKMKSQSVPIAAAATTAPASPLSGQQIAAQSIQNIMY